MTQLRRIFNLWWLPLALPLVPAVFIFTAVVNWEMGRLWGGSSIMIPAGVLYADSQALTVGHFLAVLLVALGVFQGVVFHLMADAAKARAYWLLSFFTLFSFLSIGVSAWGGIAWQAARADLMERRGAAIATDFKVATVELNHRAEATHEIRPRAASIIRAEMKALLHSTVWIGKKAHRVAALSKGCETDHWRTRKLCDRHGALALELAKAEAYSDNLSKIDEARELRDASLVLNPAALYGWANDLFSTSAESQKTSRIFAIQAIVELVAVFILPAIIWGIGRSLGAAPPPNPGAKQNENTPRRETSGGADCATASEPLNARPFDLIVAGGVRAPSKTALLKAYLADKNPRGLWEADDFLSELNIWAEARGFRRFHKSHVGGVWLACGGLKGRGYAPTTNNTTSPRTLWGWGISEGEMKQRIAERQELWRAQAAGREDGPEKSIAA